MSRVHQRRKHRIMRRRRQAGYRPQSRVPTLEIPFTPHLQGQKEKS